MSRFRSLIVAAAIIAVSVGLAAFLISLAPEPARTEPPPPIPFAQTGLVKAGAGPIPVFGAGTVRPSAEIAITPQVGGKVVWVHPGFRSGGRVRKGQTIFRIEEADYLYRVRGSKGQSRRPAGCPASGRGTGRHRPRPVRALLRKPDRYGIGLGKSPYSEGTPARSGSRGHGPRRSPPRRSESRPVANTG